MKKILVIHNKYRQIGGEDVAVQKEVELLRNYYEVETLYFSNEIQNYFTQGISFLLNTNLSSESKLKKTIHDFNPDLAYVHNTWFNASPGIFKVLDGLGVKTILKLHNFRYNCTKSFFSSQHFNNHEICNACGLDRNSIGKFNKYFQSSLFKSLLVTKYGRKYFDIIKNNKLKIFVLTEFHKEFLINLGINQEKVEVYPNYLELQNIEKDNIEEKYILYAGRISEEKGVEELVVAFKNSNSSDLNLKIIGEGPAYNKLKEKYSNQNIDFLGSRPNQEVLKIIKKSKAVVTATKLLEGQPMLLCEASSLGVPSIFPRSGGIAEFFPKDYKLSFEQFNYEDLKTKIKMIENPKILGVEGKKSKEYIKNYLDKEKLLKKFTEVLNEI